MVGEGGRKREVEAIPMSIEGSKDEERNETGKGDRQIGEREIEGER